MNIFKSIQNKFDINCQSKDMIDSQNSQYKLKSVALKIIKNFDSNLVISSQTRVKNRVTMATAYVPSDQEAYQMMCSNSRLTIKVTKFQQSSANHF